jgi:hypothetical protein
MGGSKSKPKQESQSQYKSANDPMVAFMKMQQQNQLAQQQQNKLDSQTAAENARLAEETKQQTLLDQQRQAGFSAAQQGEVAARQQLDQYGVQQRAADQAALAAQQQAQSASGFKSIAGGMGQSNQAQRAANIGMGGAGSMTPASTGMTTGMQAAANMGMGGTGQTQNQFKMPSSSGIKFGGS